MFTSSETLYEDEAFPEESHTCSQRPSCSPWFLFFMIWLIDFGPLQIIIIIIIMSKQLDVHVDILAKLTKATMAFFIGLVHCRQEDKANALSQPAYYSSLAGNSL